MQRIKIYLKITEYIALISLYIIIYIWQHIYYLSKKKERRVLYTRLYLKREIYMYGSYNANNIE